MAHRPIDGHSETMATSVDFDSTDKRSAAWRLQNCTGYELVSPASAWRNSPAAKARYAASKEYAWDREHEPLIAFEDRLVLAARDLNRAASIGSRVKDEVPAFLNLWRLPVPRTGRAEMQQHDARAPAPT